MAVRRKTHFLVLKPEQRDKILARAVTNVNYGLIVSALLIGSMLSVSIGTLVRKACMYPVCAQYIGNYAGTSQDSLTLSCTSLSNLTRGKFTWALDVFRIEARS